VTTRAYELMIIADSDVAESDIPSIITRTESLVTGEGAEIKSTDNWGRRRFAYEIDHKWEGLYFVVELVHPGGGLPELERSLRLADEVVRHKLFRLPDDEAARRGLLDGAEAPAG